MDAPGGLPASTLPDVEADDGIDRDVYDARILVVDDSPSESQLLRAYLRRAGYTNLAAASDGAEAWEAVCASPPDLVVTDLAMPRMDGIELCGRLRSDRMTSSIPVLVQTGFDTPSHRAAALRSGAAAVITKPVNAQELLALVRVHVERSRLIERLSEYKRRVAYEVDKARAMQESLLPTPDDLARFEAVYPVSLASYFRTSAGIGGDIWGIHALDASRLRIYCADFAGHGLSAALNTFRLHAFITGRSGLVDDAAAWLGQLNRFLCDVLPVGHFATMFCAVVDFSAGILQYAAAAAPSNLVLSAGTHAGFQPIDGTGFPLGVAAEALYQNNILPFGPGSTLFLYSDALVETPDPASAAFTSKKLREFLDARQSETRPAAIKAAVVEEFYSRCAAKPVDDLTIVVLTHASRQ